jgi:hypothetical protein
LRPHVSFSEISSFVNGCQHRWKLDYHDGLRSENFSIHFDFGTAVHEAVEKHFTRKDPIDIPTAIKLFEDKFEQLIAKNEHGYKEPLSKKDRDSMLASGSMIIKCLKLAPELQDVEVVHNEFELFEDIEHEHPIKFKGYIDIVLKGKDKRGNTILWVGDFKTCSWGWDRDTRSDRWKHYQLFLYKHFLCKKFDIDPKNVRTAFILLKKRPPKGSGPIEFFPVSAGPVSVQRALDTLGSTVTEMIERSKVGDFKKDRSQCKDKYGNVCPYFKSSHCPE